MCIAQGMIGDQIELTAKVSSGLPIKYSIDNSDVAEIYSNGKNYYLDCKAEGQAQILAEQEGNSNYYSSPRIRKTIEVKSVFTDKNHTLTYVVDGQVYKLYNIEYQSKITPETEPEKEGYTFSGWSDIPATMPDHDITVTGSFYINNYKLIYTIDNNVYKEVIYDYGSIIVPEPIPQGDYSSFEWVGLPNIMPAYDVIVTSKYVTSVVSEFKYNGIKYTVVSQTDQTVEVAASNQSAGSDGPTSYSGDIVIPTTVSYGDKTYTVIGIGQSAFVNCVGITSVSLPNTLTYIRKEAFNLCLGLRSITIPESVTSYGYDVFSMTSISEITVLNPVPVDIPYNAFYYPQSNNNCVLYVPYGSSNAYKNAAEWKKFKAIVEMNKKPDTLNGHEYIDLSLPSGKCWATTNYGASSPEGYGSYVYWNERNTISSEWGSDWTTPSLQDIRELENNCTWTWDSRNGHNGYTVTGKNGNSIFLPASGFQMYGQSSAKKVNEWAYYWTSDKSDDMAYIIMSSSSNVTYGQMEYNYTKLPIRPITKGNGGNTQPQKCATPSISYNNGQLKFTCATDGVEFVSEITDADIKKYNDATISLTATYNISVYAAKTGYENSETVTATLCWIDVDPKTEGVTNNVAQVRANAVIIQSNNGVVSVSGVDDGTNVTLYSADGQMAGSAMASGNQASLSTHLKKGEIAIVKIGEKSVKFVMR